MKLVLNDEDVVANPSLEQIRAAVEKLESGGHDFIRLERGGFVFLQAAKAGDERIVVEWRDGKGKEILVTEPPVAVGKAVLILQSYLSDSCQLQPFANWVALSTLPFGDVAHVGPEKRQSHAGDKNSLRGFSTCVLVGLGISISVALVSAVVLQVEVQRRLSVKAFLLLCSTFVLAGCCRVITKGRIRGRFYVVRKHESPMVFCLIAGIWCAFGVALALLTSFVR